MHLLADHKVSAALTRAIWLKFSSIRHRTYNAMAKAKRTLDELLGQTCNTCDKWFETMQGLMSHQSMSTKCVAVRRLHTADGGDGRIDSWAQNEPYLY